MKEKEGSRFERDSEREKQGGFLGVKRKPVLDQRKGGAGNSALWNTPKGFEEFLGELDGGRSII